MAERYTLDDALYMMQRLRDPVDGCPWDLQQSFKDITHFTIEECYELVDAIEQDDMVHTEEELGDVLFQVIFYAQLGAEQHTFDFESIVDNLVSKLVKRHPHVFPNGKLRERYGFQPADTPEIKSSWEAIKAEERANKSRQNLLDDVPFALPALSRAQKLQKRAANVGMDWSELAPVIDALESEVAELKQAILQQQPEPIQEEMGDVLFAAVNVARKLKLDAEQTLKQANNKFTKRIQTMEALAKAADQDLSVMDEAALDVLWQQAKRNLKEATA